MEYTTKIGLFGIGLDTYWPQFTGLRERLEGYVARVEGKLARDGVEIINLGLIDTPQKAMAAGHQFRQADVDIIFLHVTTYALSNTVLPVVQRAKVPVIVLNLAPEAAIDYAAFNRMGDRTKMTGEWLACCSACPVPADGGLMLLAAEGESVAGPILEIGNTNSRYKFSIGARRFVNDWNKHGPAHHCAIGVGHIVHKFEKLASLLNMPLIRVC